MSKWTDSFFWSWILLLSCLCVFANLLCSVTILRSIAWAALRSGALSALPPSNITESSLGAGRESAPRGTIREAGFRVAVCCLYLFQQETQILPFFNLHANQHQWSGKNCSERGKANGREHSTMIITLSLKIDENFQLGPIPNLELLKPALPTMI